MALQNNTNNESHPQSKKVRLYSGGCAVCQCSRTAVPWALLGVPMIWVVIAVIDVFVLSLAGLEQLGVHDPIPAGRAQIAAGQRCGIHCHCHVPRLHLSASSQPGVGD
jgi:hypothetical protein